MTGGHRGGFSLMEVLLATSILLGSLIVLEELARLGRRHAADAEETALAHSLAHARMNEILAGAAPLKSVEREPIAEAPDWTCDVRVEPAASPGLTETVVTVAKGDAALPRGARQTGRREKSFTLIQWMRASAPGGQIGPPSPEATQRFAARGRR
jgi:hypothetical protein